MIYFSNFLNKEGRDQNCGLAEMQPRKTNITTIKDQEESEVPVKMEVDPDKPNTLTHSHTNKSEYTYLQDDSTKPHR